MIKIPFNNRYLTLGESFYVKHKPGPVANPALIKFNVELAEAMGLSPSDFDSDVCADIFSGNVVPEGSEPIAMAYAGHQFGQYNPQLGDGRAIYLGEVDLPAGGAFDVQLKGSGPTSYSRNGDGRSALGPVLREYLVSEAMHQLNVPTTRALAAVTTGEQVVRENLIPGGIITRIASSFVRVGTFQFIAAQGNVNKVQALADYVIERNYPMALESDIPYVALLEMMVERQAMLIAKWMQLGFIHGVMNTDNMSVAGETIDYGPCAFMDIYAHDQVFSSIDYRGRYAYSNQPSIGLWNLTRLAESLLPLFSDDADEAVEIAKGILNKYIDLYEGAWLSGMRAKCGLTKSQDSIEEEDKALIETLLDTMANEHADFTLTFYYLSHLKVSPDEQDNNLRQLFDKHEAIDEWLAKWRKRLSLEPANDDKRKSMMLSVNPVYIPRNHQIEAVIRAAEDNNDFSLFHELHEVLQNPFVLQHGKDHYMLPPKPDEVVEQTFCGT